VSTGRVICVGETLWDVLPTGEFLGGAPLNCSAALRLAWAYPATVVSRVGSDDRGSRALDRIRSLGVDTRLIQSDPVHPTGIAQATLGTGMDRRLTSSPARCACRAPDRGDGRCALFEAKGAAVV
jgi:sugar/nucleoside kinase (ribokinase family)